jgi:hypothetical protein
MAKQVTQYDAAILQTYAERLYDEAKVIVQLTIVKYAAGGFALAFLVSFALSATQRIPSDAQGGTVFGVIVVMIMGGIVGYERGKKLAWKKRFEAQQLLLQMQIEKNTATLAAGEDRADPNLDPLSKGKSIGMSAV